MVMLGRIGVMRIGGMMIGVMNWGAVTIVTMIRVMLII